MTNNEAMKVLVALLREGSPVPSGAKQPSPDNEIYLGDCPAHIEPLRFPDDIIGKADSDTVAQIAIKHSHLAGEFIPGPPGSNSEVLVRVYGAVRNLTPMLQFRLHLSYLMLGTETEGHDYATEHLDYMAHESLPVAASHVHIVRDGLQQVIADILNAGINLKLHTLPQDAPTIYTSLMCNEGTSEYIEENFPWDEFGIDYYWARRELADDMAWVVDILIKGEEFGKPVYPEGVIPPLTDLYNREVHNDTP